MKLARFILGMALGAWTAGALPAPPEGTVREVEHLLSYLADSACQFHRNGEWYPAGKARDHLRRKYGYLVRKDLIRTTEHFVERAAKESSRSGQPYRVRCGDRETASAAWLTEELHRFRARSVPQPTP